LSEAEWEYGRAGLLDHENVRRVDIGEVGYSLHLGVNGGEAGAAAASGNSGRRTWVQFGSTTALARTKTGQAHVPEDEASQQHIEPDEICKTSIPGSNPGGASKIIRKICSLVRHNPRLRRWTEVDPWPAGGPTRSTWFRAPRPRHRPVRCAASDLFARSMRPARSDHRVVSHREAGTGETIMIDRESQNDRACAHDPCEHPTGGTPRQPRIGSTRRTVDRVSFPNGKGADLRTPGLKQRSTRWMNVVQKRNLISAASKLPP
jgi:hypothetical protein